MNELPVPGSEGRWTPELLASLLDTCREAAAVGGAVLSEHSRVGLAARVKGELGNLVTDADVAAERAVRALLRDSRPGDSLSGEELPEERAGRRVRWIIDPLDGTLNFTRQIPFYCTSVAAYDTVERDWLVGAVNAPGLGREYWAARGAGAWRAANGEVERLSGPQSGRDAALLGTGLSYRSNVRASQLADLPVLVAEFSDIRRLGSAALDLCLVADGTLDGYIESDLGEHDWAAGALIAAEAGLDVRRPSELGGTVSASLRQTRSSGHL